MRNIIDLSGTPAEEECAQIGRDPKASDRSFEEATAYRAAIIAAHGPPPEGYSLRVHSNAHDFGTYYTVQLICPPDLALINERYEELAEDGLAHWHQAMMPAPYDYNGKVPAPISTQSPSDEAIRRAIIASRPNPNGDFALDMFRDIHTRLVAAFPTQAENALKTIALIHAQEGRTLH